MIHCYLCIAVSLLLLSSSIEVTAEIQQKDGPGESAAFTYVPLENRKEDLACLRSYWPMNEDAFMADLHSIDASKWAIIVCRAKPEYTSSRNSAVDEDDHGGSSDMTAGNDTSTSVRFARDVGGGNAILQNRDVLEEIETLRNYIDERHVIVSDDHQYRYANVCLSYPSPDGTNRSLCHFPDINLVRLLRIPVRRSIWKSYQQPVLYPYFGDKAAPLGVKMLTGSVLGGVELDKVTGEVRSVKSIVLRYFFRRTAAAGSPGASGVDIDKISTDFRNALRDYVLNKYVSNVIDVRYVDDEMMRMPLNAKTSNANLVARLLDPTTTASDAWLWPDGLTAQLVFNAPIDLSRPAEVRRVMKALAAFENTPFTFGQEGTVCWIRAFLAWRKWLVANMYGGGDAEKVKNIQRSLSLAPPPSTPASANGEDEDIDDSDREGAFYGGGGGGISSPFGSFKEDLRVFLKNPNYPVYAQHVVLNDDGDAGPNAEGLPDVKAFRCLVTLKNLTNPNQRKIAVQYLRDIAARYPGYNVSVVAMDFFPPATQSAPHLAPSGSVVRLLVIVGLALLGCLRWIQ